MSKDNMFLGYARGKVGSVVFSRLKGQQIARAHNAHPANPKSRPQMVQRMKLGTAVAYYKLAVGKFFKFAFEDKKTVSSDYNEFVKRNVELVPYVTRENRRSGAMPVAPLVMSSGSLAPIRVTNTVVVPTSGSYANNALIQLQNVATEFAGIDPGEYTDVGELSQGIIDQNPNVFQNGDLLTLVSFRQSDPDEGILEFAYEQFKLDVTSTAALSTLTSGAILNLEGTPSGLYANFGRFSSTVSTSEQFGLAIIVTRNVEGKIYASDSEIALNTAASTAYSSYRTEATQIAATDSYGVGFTAILNPEGK